MRLLRFIPAALALTSLPGLVWASGHSYPALAARKDSLGTVSIVADAVMFQDSKGDTDKIFLDDSRRIAGIVLDAVTEQMTAKGYHAQRRPLLSVGRMMGFGRVCKTWEQHGEDIAAFPLAHGPFYTDSTLSPDSTAAASWTQAFAAAGMEFLRKKDAPPLPPVPLEPLRGVVSTDHLFLVHAEITRVSGKKRFGLSLAGLKKIVGTAFDFALIDGRTGEILWENFRFYEDQVPDDAKTAGDMVKKVLKDLP